MIDIPVRDAATYYAYSGGWKGVRRMPERAAYRTFRGLADTSYRRNGKGVRRLRSNLAVARPEAAGEELDALTQEGMRSYMRYWCDAFRLPDWRPEDIPSRVRVQGRQIFADQLAAGRGLLVALPHMANWDLAGAWACLDLAPVTTVAEQLRPERLFDAFVDFRRELGMEILALGGEQVFERLQGALAENHVVPLLADRDLTSSGVRVDLLGQPAMVPAGTAVLSQRTGLPVVPVTLSYAGDEPEHCLVVDVHDPVEPSRADDPDERVRRTSQAMADGLSVGLREHPEDWHMLQRVFVADLDPNRLPPAAREADQ